MFFNKLQNIQQYDEVSISETENEDLSFTPEVVKEKIIQQLGVLGTIASVNSTGSKDLPKWSTC